MTIQQEPEQDTASLIEKARQWRAVWAFFRSHPEILPVDANRSAIFHHFGNAPEQISEQSLEIALTDPRLRAELAFNTPVKVEAEIEPESSQESPGQIPAHINRKAMRQMAAIQFRRLIETYGEDAVMSRFNEQD